MRLEVEWFPAADQGDLGEVIWWRGGLGAEVPGQLLSMNPNILTPITGETRIKKALLPGNTLNIWPLGQDGIERFANFVVPIGGVPRDQWLWSDGGVLHEEPCRIH